MKLTDVLTGEEVEDYYKQWGDFGGKFTPQTCLDAHSGLPVIGRLFQYEDKPVFRAKVLKRTLKRFDPYFMANEYLHPNFHTMHYFSPIEQVGHASLDRLVDGYGRFLIVERFSISRSQEMLSPVSFDESHPSIEAVIDLKQWKRKFFGEITVTFYEDSNNGPLQTWFLEGKGELRNYVRCIERLKKGDESVREELVRKIEGENLRHRHLIVPRKTLVTTKEELIKAIRGGEIPEEELHDFFSLWD